MDKLYYMISQININYIFYIAHRHFKPGKIGPQNAGVTFRNLVISDALTESPHRKIGRFFGSGKLGTPFPPLESSPCFFGC